MFDWISIKAACFTAAGTTADSVAYHITNHLTRTHARTVLRDKRTYWNETNGPLFLFDCIVAVCVVASISFK